MTIDSHSRSRLFFNVRLDIENIKLPLPHVLQFTLLLGKHGPLLHELFYTEKI